MNKLISIVLIFLFISGSFVTALNPVSASELVEDSWNTKTPPNQERKWFRVVAFDGKIYAIGGFYYETVGEPPLGYITEHFLDTTERYDLLTDTWVTLEPMPTPKASFAITVYHDKIYCIDNSPLFSCVVEVYDPATDSWSTKNYNLPFRLYSRNMQAYVVDGKIFLIDLYALFVYDPAEDSFIEKTQIPYIEPRHGIVSAVMDDKLLIFYVVESAYPYDRPNNVHVLIYDPKTDIWSEGKTQEIGVHGNIMATGATTGVYTPKNIYVLGFKTGQSIIWVYDLVKDAWSTAKDMPDFSVCDVAVVDDVLYIFGRIDNHEVNMQYVPAGYGSALPSVSSPSSDGTWDFLTGSVVAIIVLTIGVVAGGLFFVFKLRKNA
ncbi:hypothetical protein [Candidatus Bathycorpusculum sp.]|uniref:Kelch repeat-containing protein n=1 Tax=Candidatus Bathycorpusculum sp. TaxID=2994959 RepID=UPI00282597ED|nr:hypothetical protein [Candidatus Termitimicrobium sp.]MCL2684928.1 hypothetical protein [Candidatus Termitimicrobium sp.]